MYCDDHPEDRVHGCYCNEDQGAGYTFNDEHGPCDACLAKLAEISHKENNPDS